MLSIGAMAKGAGAYYLDLAREDYYLQGGEPPGKWWGAGAKVLGLNGEVTRPDLQKLLAGFNPAGEPLIQNAGKTNHQPGWDLTFSAPKSVSVLWSQADEQTRQTVQEAHHAAVTTALAYLQDDASFSRRGKEGTERDSAGLVVATFEHGTSRALDPQLHTHALVLNVATRPDQTTGTLVSKPIYRHKMAAGALYRCELAFRLAQELGVICNPEKTWFEVQGVPKQLTDEFSKRRKAIEKELAALNLETASAAAFATLSTREAKGVVPPRGELFGTWQKVGQAFGFSFKNAIGLASKEQTVQPTAINAAIKEGIKTTIKHQSYFFEKDLMRRTAEAAQTLGLPAKDVCELTKNFIATSKKLVTISDNQGDRCFTTTDNIALEKKLLRQAKSLSWGIRHGVPTLIANRIEKAYAAERSQILKELTHHAKQLVKAFRRKKTKAINRPTAFKDSTKKFLREHVRAFRHLTRKGKGNIRIVDGISGTEKNLLHRAVREAYEKAGYTVLGVTPSSKAARKFESSTGIASITFDALEYLMRHPFKHTPLHHAKQVLQEALRIKPLRRLKLGQPLKRFKLGKKTVLIVDDAEQISNQRIASLVKSAKKQKGVLILSGDSAGMSPIEAGGAFAQLAKSIGCSVLRRVVRQCHHDDRKLVAEAAKGNGRAVLDDLARRGLLTISSDRNYATHKLIDTWFKKEAGRRDKSLILCGTAPEAASINVQCQAKRLEGREFANADMFTLDGNTFYKGDRVAFLKTNKPLGVSSNDLGTITSVNSTRDRFSVLLDDGRRVVIPFRTFKGFALGYAIPSSSASTTTIERSYLLMGGQLQDRELAYLQVSRATEQTHVFANQKEGGKNLEYLAEQMSQSRAKTFAHEIREQAKKPEPAPSQPGVSR